MSLLSSLISLLFALAVPWDGTIPSGPRLIRGFAWSPRGRMASVKYSVDGGPWLEAKIADPGSPLTWSRFYIPFAGKPGRHYIAPGATDDKGNTQPFSVPFNKLGYLYNAVVSHPFYVA